MRKAENATIRWFDTVSGQGLINIEGTDESVYIHWTAMLDARTRGYLVSESVYAELEAMGAGEKGKQCLVIVTRDSHYKQIDACVFI